MDVKIAAAGWICATGSSQDPREALPIEQLAGGPVRRAWGVDPGLEGAPRWRALAAGALADLGVELEASIPLVVASCNGAGSSSNWPTAFDSGSLLKETPWAGAAVPIVSASCVSALHAVDHAQALLAGGAERVVVLAVDALSGGNQANFAGLRILDPNPRPFQASNPGFVCGEAGVALLLTAAGDGLKLGQPGLSQDVGGHDGLAHALHAVSPRGVGAMIGQGTGPEASDRAELRSLGDLQAPLTSPAFSVGHTLGASAALSLAWLAQGVLPTLPWATAFDGRPLVTEAQAIPGTAVCGRALGGSCAALGTGSAAGAAPESGWVALGPAPAVFHPGLRRLVAEAPARRPAEPPDRVVLHLDAPCAPPPRAQVGGRVLPSAVLELTPATAARLLAGAWGYTGPATAWVGGSEPEVERLLAAHRARGERVVCARVVDVNGEFRISWGAEEGRT